MCIEGGVNTKRLIQIITPTIPMHPKLLRVAAYARVSSGKDAMLHSLSAQVSYYSQMIQNNPEWLYCGVYADEALTGTKSNRAEFQKLLTECRIGKIDKINFSFCQKYCNFTGNGERIKRIRSGCIF